MKDKRLKFYHSLRVQVAHNYIFERKKIRNLTREKICHFIKVSIQFL